MFIHIWGSYGINGTNLLDEIGKIDKNTYFHATTGLLLHGYYLLSYSHARNIYIFFHIFISN